MAKHFNMPDFLQGENYEEILSRMLNELPSTIGKEENGWVCDLFSPVAIEHARAIQFVLLEAIKNIIPKFSYGEILLGHAENRGIFPKSATYARAVLQLTGIAGTVIPSGFQFSTTASIDEPGIIFSVLHEATIPETGIAVIETQCEMAGKQGNVSAETIILMVKPLKGILSVSNPLPAFGGYEAESEESIRQRIEEFDLTQGNSFVGSSADYRRWAMEVAGVGDVQVIPAENDTGVVTIVLTDLNGQPANQELCRAVENYILRPESIYDRLAPINALLHVIPAQTVEIAVSATVSLIEGFDIANVITEFTRLLNDYLRRIKQQQSIKYSEVGAILIHTSGVSDYSGLLLNGDAENIFVGNGEVPVVKKDGVVLIV